MKKKPIQIAIIARPPTTAPAIAPFGVLWLGSGVGTKDGPAETEPEGCDVREAARVLREGARVVQAGGPMATRFEVVDC